MRPGTWLVADRRGTTHTHYGHTIINYDGGSGDALFQSNDNWYYGPVTINWFSCSFAYRRQNHYYFGPVTINYIGSGTYGSSMPGEHHYCSVEPVTINYVEGVSRRPDEPLELRDGGGSEHATGGYIYNRIAHRAPVPGCMPVNPGYRALNLLELIRGMNLGKKGRPAGIQLVTNGHAMVYGGPWPKRVNRNAGPDGLEMDDNDRPIPIDSGHREMHINDNPKMYRRQPRLKGGHQPWSPWSQWSTVDEGRATKVEWHTRATGMGTTHKRMETTTRRTDDARRTANGAGIPAGVPGTK